MNLHPRNDSDQYGYGFLFCSDKTRISVRYLPIYAGPHRQRVADWSVTSRSLPARESGRGQVWMAPADQKRAGSAGSCMPKCSPSASTGTPGSSSKRPWKTSALRSPSITSRCATPPSSFVELAEWWSRHRFEDFLFAYGARRRGGRLVVDKYSRRGLRQID